ncbi:hypothetical protein CEP14_14580 [Cylindrospermopsis raciborskii C04]|uniref:Uncharacterized protein n=1 Tax=Cylindrospermopsis raciborskii C07 TaxID=2014886 RepID=A0ABX4WLD2_9CYAN|nr:hypothetical protein CEP14_14580 [Cylindrospermopsis raciborskii C04]PNJ93100.1 hypothetical protein CEP13_13355 [Cylindrospermopsis raciborskii C03]PNJ96042.1 hypothetical protein CEP15_11055 [Cylindrospermopsis raciborskii C07]PNK15871.1 hypothetical protein CEP07_11025 [Cylindrospermopsis raciborskii S01]
MGGFGPFISPGEFTFASASNTIESTGFISRGKEEVAGSDAFLYFWRKVVFGGFEVVEGKTTGNRVVGK